MRDEIPFGWGSLGEASDRRGDGTDPDPPRSFIIAVKVAGHLKRLGVPHPAAVGQARQVAAGPTRWVRLVRTYFAARRGGADPTAALRVAYTAVGVTPATRPVVGGKPVLGVVG